MIESLGECGAGTSPTGAEWLGSLHVEQPQAMYGAVIPLPAPEAVIGRAGGIRLDSPLVSREHAIVWSSGGQVWLRDACSANGTFVNGFRLSAARPLRDGDRIGIGDVVAVFTTETTPEPVATAFPFARTETTRYLSAAVHLDR